MQQMLDATERCGARLGKGIQSLRCLMLVGPAVG
jgi:hypothetical protein